MAKDIHPAVSQFSERDYFTGWAFEEVRAYAWGFVEGGDVKHAIQRPHIHGRPEDVPGLIRNAWRIHNYAAECGFWPDGPGQWLNSRHDPEKAFYLNRCEKCLEVIGAPILPKQHVDSRRNRKGARVNYEFNRTPDTPLVYGHTSQRPRFQLEPPGTQGRGSKLTPEAVQDIRSSTLPYSQLASKYGITTSSVGLIKKRQLWKDIP